MYGARLRDEGASLRDEGGRLRNGSRRRRGRRIRDDSGTGGGVSLGHKRDDKVAGGSEDGVDEGVAGGTRARVLPCAFQGFPQSVDNRHDIEGLGHVVAVELDQVPNTLAFRLDLADNGLRPAANSEAQAKRTGLGDDRSRPDCRGLLLPLLVVGLSADPDGGLALDSNFQWLIAILDRDLDVVFGAA